jgi:hypothetical protein
LIYSLRSAIAASSSAPSRCSGATHFSVGMDADRNEGFERGKAMTGINCFAQH